jgi:hypothetical protein
MLIEWKQSPMVGWTHITNCSQKYRFISVFHESSKNWTPRVFLWGCTLINLLSFRTVCFAITGTGSSMMKNNTSWQKALVVNQSMSRSTLNVCKDCTNSNVRGCSFEWLHILLMTGRWNESTSWIHQATLADTKTGALCLFEWLLWSHANRPLYCASVL